MKRITAIALLSALLFISCSKDNDPAPNTSLEGLWIGTYSVDGFPGLGQQYFSYVIKPDGTLVTDSKASGKQNICTGTWTQTGTTVNFSYTVVYSQGGDDGIVQTSTATWDKASKLTGAYQNSNGDNSTGTFTITKVQ